ncbi:MAG: membrane protein insertion efficiency factor YidD [bacterium]
MRRGLLALTAFVVVALGGYDAAGVSARWLVDVWQLVLSPLQTPNTCNFHPTCSQFTREAIETRGLPAGAVIGADRLLRCQPFAWGQQDRVYFGTTGGRLNDPVANHLCADPSLPEAPASPPPALFDDSLPVFLRDEAAGFVRWLWYRRDWHRAGVELTRVAWLLTDSTAAALARLAAGEAFLRAGEHDAARASFLDALPRAGTAALLGAARADFAAERYDSCRTLLSRSPGRGTERDAQVLAGWCRYRERRFADAALVFAGLNDPELAPLARMDGRDIPRRSRALAMLLSAVVPGAGQVYSGRAGDGAYSFLAVAGSGLLTWWFGSDAPRRDPDFVKTGIFGVTTAISYAGAVHGAGIAARDFNRWQERRYVARADELLSRVRLATGSPASLPGQ